MLRIDEEECERGLWNLLNHLALLLSSLLPPDLQPEKNVKTKLRKESYIQSAVHNIPQLFIPSPPHASSPSPILVIAGRGNKANKLP